MVKEIKISDFDYQLPDERIARHPLAQRDSCKLLVSRSKGECLHSHFSELSSFIPQGSLLVCNDTRVINARMRFEKETGSKIEVFLLDPISPEDYVLMFQSRGRCSWSCMVGNLKRWKNAPLTKTLLIDGKSVVLTAERKEARPGNSHEIEFSWDDDTITFASIVDAAGYIPIPPYLKRDSEACDSDDYQTVYAKIKGSVAAPTAGLHFTPTVFDALRKNGVDVLSVTLHVGAGTFQPVKSDTIGEHPMHTETFSVGRELVECLVAALRSGRRITAVGTTSVRTLESLPYLGRHIAEGREDMLVCQWEAYESDGSMDDSLLKEDTVSSLEAILGYMDKHGVNVLTAATSIMIAPGFRWRIVGQMVTNFHQPQSTLLLLVSSFLGGTTDEEMPRWRSLYNEALANDYRFLSYGDACYFEKG